MAGLEETFFAVGADASVSALVDDVRPAFVFDRSGTRLLWANAAGALSLGSDLQSLLSRYFPSSSPLARRISVVAGQLGAGQSRTDRITLPRGLVPSPVLCRVTRIAIGEHRGVLVVDLESRSRIATADEARERYAALSAGLLPQQEPIDEALAEEVPEPAANAELAAPASLEEADPTASGDQSAAERLAADEPSSDSSDDTATESRPGATGTEASSAAEPADAEVADAEVGEPAERADADTPADEIGSAEPPLVTEFDDFADQAITADADEGIDVDSADADSQTDAGVPETAADDASSHTALDEAASGSTAVPIVTEPLAETGVSGQPVDARNPVSDEAVVDEPTAASSTSTGFVFPQHGRSIRFVFELSPGFKFSFISPELADTVGGETAPGNGETWSDLAQRLDLDPSGRVLQALRRHDTFTGLTVDWPVEGVALRVPVDLAGMPVFARDRAFRGYRGFGIAKTGASFTVASAAPNHAPVEEVPAEQILDTAPPFGSIVEDDVSTAEAPALLEDVEPIVLIDAFGDDQDVQSAGDSTQDVYLEDGAVPADAAALEDAAADGPDAANVEEPAEADAGVGAYDPFLTDTDESVPRDVSPDEGWETEAATIEADPPAQHEPDFSGGEAISASLGETEEADAWGSADTASAEIESPAEAQTDAAEAAFAMLNPADEENTPPQLVDVSPAAGTDDPALSMEEAPAIVVDSVPEVVHDITGGDAEADPVRGPDSQTLSAAEAELYASGPEIEAFSADTTEAYEPAALNEAVALAHADTIEASPDSQPDFETAEVDPAFSDDDQPSDEVLEALAADETPEGSRFNTGADEDQLFPDDEQDETDLVWQEPRGEVIQSPVIARPIPPEEPLSPEEAERRQLSRPEREAFQKIAEALGARVEDGGKAGAPGRRDVMRVVPAKQMQDDASSAPIDSAILDRLPVPLAILKNGDAVLVNRAFLELSGYESAADLDARGGFAEAFVGSPVARQGGLPAIRRQDGSTVAVEARLHSVTFNGGIASLVVVQPTGTAGPAAAYATPPAQDIDARSRELEAILDTATDGVLVIDDRGIIVGANRSAEALFGTERETMLGAPVVNLLAPESHRAALDYLDGLARNGVASLLNDGREVIGRVQQGGLVPLFMTMGRVSPGRFCAVLRDITQWKRAEEELTNAKRSAENASSQKSDFLAKISHEIRTPLNAIIGFSEVMMEERFGPVGSERYKEYLRDIHSSGTLIMSLVNDLLDLSKIEAGKLDLSFEAVALNDVLRECVALMQPQANRERVIIRTSLSSTVPNVVADPRSLRQIVLNLLSNAIKFNSAGGQVIVSTIYEDSGEVAIRVRDTGPGMSAEDLERALEPFRQLHTSRPARGTGLGLPLTKALVEANRAAFRIDSTVGQGTLVQITFPSTRVLAE